MTTKALIAMTAILTMCGAAMSEELPDFRKLWDFRDPAGTEKRFREILPKAEASGNADYHLQLLTQIARTHGLRRNFEEAMKILDGVEKKLTKATPKAGLRYLLERGRAFNSSGKKDSAKPLFQKAFERAKKLGEDGLAVDAAHMMGIVEPPEKQLEWNLKALEVVESTRDENVKGWAGPLYHNIAMTHQDAKEYETALGWFMKGYEFRLKRGDRVGIRIGKWCVAHMLRRLDRLEPALRMQREMEIECREHGDPDGYVCEEIGEILLATGKAEEATPYFKRAWAILKDEHWIKESDPDRLVRLKKLAGEE